MKKIIAALTLCLMVFSMFFAIVGCKPSEGENNNEGGSNNGGSQNKDPESAIASVTAKEASTTVKVGESVLLTSLYEVKGTASLSAAQRACTYVSSNPEVVEINAKRAEAVAPGTATITVTSNVDNTKSCTFDIVVEKVFIDRELTMIPSEDDFSNEWNNETNTGSFRTHSGITNFYYIADIYSTQWYVETEITLHGVNWDDRWPKIGIVASGKNSEETETMVAFFLNASIGLADSYDANGQLVKGQDNDNWNEFGVCEVAEGNHWAWEQGITNSLARHHDYAWKLPEGTFVTYETKFKLGVARDGLNFHVYINDNYAGSFMLDTKLDILCEDGQTFASNVGFYHFSSDATFSGYSATADAAEVAKKIPETPVYCEFLED